MNLFSHVNSTVHQRYNKTKSKTLPYSKGLTDRYYTNIDMIQLKQLLANLQIQS